MVVKIKKRKICIAEIAKTGYTAKKRQFLQNKFVSINDGYVVKNIKIRAGSGTTSNPSNIIENFNDEYASQKETKILTTTKIIIRKIFLFILYLLYQEIKKPSTTKKVFGRDAFDTRR